MTENLQYLEASIVKHLVSNGAAPFQEIKSATRVSSPTLIRALQNLSDANWISPIGRASSTGGRPATLYGLDPSTYAILGIHLELPTVRLVLTDLQGHSIANALLSAQRFSPNEVVAAIASKFKKMSRQYPAYEILGAGLATPGYVDSQRGEILLVGRMPIWRNFPIKARLEAALGFPVVVENDIDCMARIEQRAIGLTSDFIYLGFIEGIKASLYLRGQFYKGPFGNAGLIGHTAVDQDGTVCQCGKRGCLETVASMHAICDRFDRLVSETHQTDAIIRKIQSCDDHWCKYRMITEAAASHHPLCSEVVLRALELLALAVSTLICLVQVETLILGGALSTLPGGLRDRFDQSLRTRLPSLLSHQLVVQYAHATSDDVAAVGGAQQFLQNYLAQADPLAH